MSRTRTDIEGMRAGQDCCLLLQTALTEAEELKTDISAVLSKASEVSLPKHLREMLRVQHAGLWELRKMKEAQISSLVNRLPNPLQQQVEPAKPTSGWMELTNNKGRKYSLNFTTGGSVQDMPDELKKSLDIPSAVKASPHAKGTPSLQASANATETLPHKWLTLGEFDSPLWPSTPDSSEVDGEAPTPAAPRKAPSSSQYTYLPSKRHPSVPAMPPPPQKQQWGKYDSPPPPPNTSSKGEEAPAPAAPLKAAPRPSPTRRRSSKHHAALSALLPPLKRRAAAAANPPPASPISSCGLDGDDGEEEAGPPSASFAAFDHAAEANKYEPPAWQNPSPWSSSRPYGLALPSYPSPKRHAGGRPYHSPYSPLGLNRPGAPAWQTPYPGFLSRRDALTPVPPHLPLAPPPSPLYS